MSKTRIVFIGIKESIESRVCLEALYENSNLDMLTPILFSLEDWLKSQSLKQRFFYLLRKVTLKQALRYVLGFCQDKETIINYQKNKPYLISSSSELKSYLFKYEFDFAIVCSFPFKIRKEIREAAKFCFLNLHSNDIQLLRGEFPIEAAILENQHSNAISLHVMTEEYDFGRVLAKKEYKISDCYSWEQIIARNRIALRQIVSNIDNCLVKKCVEEGEKKVTNKGKLIAVSWIKRNLIDFYIIKNFFLNYIRKLINR